MICYRILRGTIGYCLEKGLRFGQMLIGVINIHRGDEWGRGGVPQWGEGVEVPNLRFLQTMRIRAD